MKVHNPEQAGKENVCESSNKDKTALIIGCSGTFGGAVGRELKNRGWNVKGLMRHPGNRPEWLVESNVVEGDCASYKDVERAASGAELIVYGANPLYTEWHEKAEAMLEPTVRVAEEHSLHILFPGNVYGFDPSKTKIIDEESLQSPVNDKGEIRLKMEQRLKKAAERGATVTLVRFGDFIAKNANSAMFNHLLVKRGSGWKLANPSTEDHRHSYVWMPDAAVNAVSLLNHDQGGFNIWHEPGITPTHQEWIDAFSASNVAVRSGRFPWWVLKTGSLFSPMMREVVKMRYLWQQELFLDGTKMKNALGGEYRCSSLKKIAAELAG